MTLTSFFTALCPVSSLTDTGVSVVGYLWQEGHLTLHSPVTGSSGTPRHGAKYREMKSKTSPVVSTQPFDSVPWSVTITPRTIPAEWADVIAWKSGQKLSKSFLYKNKKNLTSTVHVRVRAPVVQTLESTITFQRINARDTNCVIQWIEIYLADSFVHLSLNSARRISDYFCSFANTFTNVLHFVSHLSL